MVDQQAENTEAQELDPATKIEQQETQEREDDDSNESPPSDIVAYNELRSGADILRMYQEGDLIIQPDFQRDVVWNSTDQTRFIDSLIKQLPIPSMCFAYDAKKNEWLVIDGLQRISTIIRFLNGEDWRLSNLTDIDAVLRNKSAAGFKTAKPGTDLRKIFSKVQNQTIPINVLRCDFSKKNHNEYLFTIFHRLNSGGLKLNNQEIRNCIYSGAFNKALKVWDNNENWRSVNNMQPGENYRFAKQEAILRFFAFLKNRKNYKGSVAKFLNDYMSEHRHADAEVLKEHGDTFGRVAKVLAEKFVTQRPAPRIPGTVLEAIMVGIAQNLDHLENSTAAHCQQLLTQFRAHNSISDTELAEGLSKKDKVDARLDAATEIFAA
ncbi:hypothetical protein ASE36_15495 [Rhizobium sp. Root274]|uniref:DUF262 domain-containing protein n=1 Tax=unclassified Rhizobium TaxID=2613769 RepID=UPI0007124A96|nr:MULTISPECIES: DUF262 domain-containing protein [unclassified Rhizobium]KQW27880.1 hypothetical protein ASC71_15525 [Rhizobium sp. Root1240]KRD28161.1 hypothetical protein ASE36_15495 [Rhizobium sp. Root274]